MRTVKGMKEGRALLSRQPGYDEPELPAAAALRTQEIFGEALSATQTVRRVLDMA